MPSLFNQPVPGGDYSVAPDQTNDQYRMPTSTGIPDPRTAQPTMTSSPMNLPSPVPPTMTGQPVQKLNLESVAAKENIAHAARNMLKSDEGASLYKNMSGSFPELGALDKVINPPDIYKSDEATNMRFSPQQRIEQAFNIGKLGGNSLQIAQGFIGAEESKDNRVLSTFFEKATGDKLDPVKVPWCAQFANSVLAAGGISGTGSLQAKSFMKWGVPIETPSKGDIVVLNRGSDPKKGHVGFFIGMDGDNVRILGGNQGNSVSVQTYPSSQVAGYRRIHPKGLEDYVDKKYGDKPLMGKYDINVVQNVPGVGQSQNPKDDTIGKTMQAIAGIESSEAKDPYKLQSKATRGDRAYGKYQIMGNNIGWMSKEALGRKVSKEEYMNNPEIQEQIARYQINKLIKKYGPEGAARAWFAGEGGMNKMNRKDAYGTSVKGYSNRFKGLYGK